MQSSVLSLPAGPLSQTQQQAGCCSMGRTGRKPPARCWALWLGRGCARDGLALGAHLEMRVLGNPGAGPSHRSTERPVSRDGFIVPRGMQKIPLQQLREAPHTGLLLFSPRGIVVPSHSDPCLVSCSCSPTAQGTAGLGLGECRRGR